MAREGVGREKGVRGKVCESRGGKMARERLVNVREGAKSGEFER